MLLKCKIDKKDLDKKDKLYWRWKLKAVFVYKSVYKSEHKKSESNHKDQIISTVEILVLILVADANERNIRTFISCLVYSLFLALGTFEFDCGYIIS